MSVHIHRRSGAGWTQLSNELLRDPRMSFKARGVLCTMLSHEDGWQQSVAYTLTEATDGRDATRSALVELERLGYVTRIRKQAKKGRWVTDIHVYDYAKHAGYPASDQPTTEEPTTEMASLDVKALDVEPLGEEPLGASLAPNGASEHNRIFDVLVACYGNPTDKARGAYGSAAQTLAAYGADPQDVRNFIAALRWGEKDWAVVTPTAVAKYFGSRENLTVSNGSSRTTRTGAALAAQLEAEGR